MIDRYLLIYYREINNLTHKALSKKIHVSANKIAAWEKGELKLRDKDIEKICSLYNITIEDLLKEESTYKANIIGSLILLLFLIGIGILLKSISIMIILPIVGIVLYNSSLIIRNIFNEKENNINVPKSLFGIKLEEDKKIIYLVESLTISSIYIIFNIICKIFNLSYFIINITIVDNMEYNFLIIWIILFALLTVLIYIIEYIFGEIMLKKYKGE